MRAKGAGKLRHRLEFQTESLSDDGQGGSTASWSTVVTVWGSLEPLSASQVNFAASLGHRVSHRIEIRAGTVTGLSAKMRVVFESRVFHIKSFRNLEERDRRIEIQAEEGDAS